MTPAAQTVYIDLETGHARAGVEGLAAPIIELILLTGGRLNFAFMTDGVVEALEAASTGELVIKACDDTDGDRLFEDTAWSESGTGEDTRYAFAALVDSSALRTALRGKKYAEFDMQVRWNQPSDDHDSACHMFHIVIHNNIVRDGDSAPVITDDVDLVINDANSAFEAFVNGVSKGFLHLVDTAP